MENRNKINSDQLPGSTSQGKIKTVIQTLLLDFWKSELLAVQIKEATSTMYISF